MNNKLEVIGIDHGWSMMKTISQVFVTGVKEITTTPALFGDVLEYEGKFYKVGTVRQEVKDTKVEDDSFYLLTLAAVAKELKRRGLAESKVFLAVGLPLTRFGAEKNDFIKYLTKNKRVSFKYENEPYHIEIDDVAVFPQCYAAVVDKIPAMAKKTLIVDIGSWTIDIMPVINKSPDESKCVTIPKGLITCMRSINEQCVRQLKQYTTYPSKVEHTSFFTDDDGDLILPEALKIGNYRIEEVSAPFGYVVNDKYVNISVDTDTAFETDGDTNEAIITVEYSDAPAVGELTVEKKGEVLDGFKGGLLASSYEKEFVYKEGSLAGAKFEVYAAEDIYTADNQKDADGNRIKYYSKGDLVATLTTGKDGKAVAKNFPLGQYKVVEVEAPYGYVLNPNEQKVTFTYVDDKTPVIKENAQGIDTPSAYKKRKGSRNFFHAVEVKSLWSTSSIRDILNDEVYLGKLIWNKTKKRIGSNNTSSYVPKDEWMVIENCHEPIITQELFDMAHANSKKCVRLKRGKRNYNPFYYCGVCGRALVPSKRVKGDILLCYSSRIEENSPCKNNRVEVAKVEDAIMKIVNMYATAYLDEKGIKKAGKSKEVSPEEKIATLEKKVKSLSSKKMMLYSDYKDDKLTREEYVKRSKAMVEQIDELHQEIEQLKTEIPPEDNSSSKFETQLESIINMESFDREKIQKVIKKVIINGEDNIEIVWNTDDPFFK